MPLSSLARVVASLARPAAGLDEHGVIVCVNEAFQQAFGWNEQLHKQSVCEFYPAVSPSVGIATLLNDRKPGWRGAELPLTGRGKGLLYWVEVLSYENAVGVFTRLMTLHDIRGYHELEAAYLSRIRHIADDNLWILNPSGMLIWARTDSKALDAYVGRPVHDLIMLEDRRIWQSALEQARATPGYEVECNVRGALHGHAKVIDLCYLTGGPWGGRFYAASRETTPVGGRVIRRLKEAWQVERNAALAAKLGTTGSSISRASKQEDVPSAWLIETADGTGVSLDWLRYGHGEKWRVKV